MASLQSAKTYAVLLVSLLGLNLPAMAQTEANVAVVSGGDAIANQQQPHQLSAMTTAAGIDKYQIERAKVVSRIEALRAKGVGVAPYVQEIIRIDDVYTHGGDAVSMVSRLDNSVTEQEKARQDMQNLVAGHSQPAVAAAPAARAAGARSDLSVADYNGSMDGFVQQMVNSFVTKEVGQWVPRKGPFMIERLRIARRIHELEGKNVRVDGLGNLYRNMEDVVATQDPRRLSELSTDIRYLQSQLGLSQLEGSFHRPIGI
ncbi:MAG TPA: hypothetical protein V6C69_19305 [Trichormus sp.]|jgi:hypothetical protein